MSDIRKEALHGITKKSVIAWLAYPQKTMSTIRRMPVDEAIGLCFPYVGNSLLQNLFGISI